MEGYFKEASYLGVWFIREGGFEEGRFFERRSNYGGVAYSKDQVIQEELLLGIGGLVSKRQVISGGGGLFTNI